MIRLILISILLAAAGPVFAWDELAPPKMEHAERHKCRFVLDNKKQQAECRKCLKRPDRTYHAYVREGARCKRIPKQ